MKKIIIEELERMLYLTSHKRGVVISEQKIILKEKKGSNDGDWDGKSEGVLNFSGKYKSVTGTPLLAKNVPFGGQNTDLLIQGSVGKNLPTVVTIVTTEREPNTDKQLGPVKFEFKDSTYPYLDNMIGPTWKMNPKAKQLFDYSMKILIDNIKKRGEKAVQKIKFQGSADKSTPGLKAPIGFQLDHDLAGCNKPYCGETSDKFKMNQFLADKRAEVMKINVIKQVLKETKIDLSNKVEVLKGINYYGGTEQGVKSVSIEIVPDGGDEGGGSTPDEIRTKTEVIFSPPKLKSGKLNLSNQGGGEVDFYESLNPKSYSFIALEQSVGDELVKSGVLPNVAKYVKDQLIVPASIDDNNSITIDGKNWGTIESKTEAGDTATIASTDGIWCVFGVEEGMTLLKNYKVKLVKQKDF